ncbi:MAG: hypothetical protein JW795_16435 [Chitinivibrionales bacterium]|nr:hypothetical protein [Chitinivibrionales bacterium]
MRPCTVALWNDKTQKYDLLIENARFHEWLNDGKAIVEMPDGSCEFVSLSQIKFLVPEHEPEMCNHKYED